MTKRKLDCMAEYRQNNKKIKNIINNDDSDNDESSDKNDENINITTNHLYFLSDITLKSIDKVKILMRQYALDFLQLKKNNNIKDLDPMPLYIHINSHGGSVYAGLSLYDFIIEYKKKIPIYTIVEGIVASAATFISIAGTERYMNPNSYMLIHQLSSSMIGNFEQLKEEFYNSEKIMKKIINLYVLHTKLSSKKLTEILKHDIIWDSEECLKNGIIDKIKLIDVFDNL
jgi:ATP-dependent protease ClpP protease subunit